MPVAKPIPLAELKKENTPNASTKPPPPPQTQAFSTLEGTYIHSDIDDYVFQFFMGSVSVLGLFILFRIIQKSK